MQYLQHKTYLDDSTESIVSFINLYIFRWQIIYFSSSAITEINIYHHVVGETRV